MIRIVSLLIMFLATFYSFGQDNAETDSVSVSESDSVSKAVSEPDSVSISESDSISKVVSEPDSVSISESDTVSKAVSVSEPDSVSISESDTVSKAVSVSEADSVSISESDTVSKAVSVSEAVSETESANLFHRSINAQRPWLAHVSIDGFVGMHYFHGDISETKSIPKFNSDFRDVTGRSSGIGVNRANIYGGIGASLHYIQGEIRGRKYVRHNNNYYSSSMNYYNVMLDAFYPIKLIHSEAKGHHTRYELHPHMGVGLMFYRSKSSYTHEVNGPKTFQYYGYLAPADDLSSLTGVLEETKREVAFVVPTGVKLKLYLNSRYDLNLDYTYVKSFTDKLDGWEKEGTANDSYSRLSFGISYNFNNSDDDVHFSKLDIRHGTSGNTGGNEIGNSSDSSYDEDMDKTGLFGNIFKEIPGDFSEGREVFLVNEDGKIMYKTNLDKEGNFNFENLPADQNFLVRVQEPDTDLNMIVLNELGEFESKAKRTPEGDFEFQRAEDVDPSSLSSKDRMMDLLLKLYKTQLRIIQYQHLDE